MLVREIFFRLLAFPILFLISYFVFASEITSELV